MHTAYNKCCQTAMQYWMHGFMECVTDSKTYSTTFLNNFCHQPSAAEKFVYVGGTALEVVRFSMEIQTENGIYHSNDFLYWKEGGNYCGGVAVRFYETPYMDPSVVFLAKVHRYELLPGPSGMMESGATMFVDMRDIIDSVSIKNTKKPAEILKFNLKYLFPLSLSCAKENFLEKYLYKLHPPINIKALIINQGLFNQLDFP